MSLGKRLKQAMKEKGVSNYRLAKDLKINNTTVSNYLEDKVKKPNALILDGIIKYLGVSESWIITGKEDVELDLIGKAPSILEVATKNNTKEVSLQHQIDLLHKKMSEQEEEINQIKKLFLSLLKENLREEILKKEKTLFKEI